MAKNFKNFRTITIFHDENGESGASYFVFPSEANHGEIFETLAAHGYEPEGRHNMSAHDCSGLLCSTRITIEETAKHTIVSQRFYRDI